MKKHLTRILIPVTLLILLCLLTACNVQFRPLGPQETACKHEFATSGSTATCTEAGEILSTCSKCGETKREAQPALGHDYQEQETPGVIAPTCTEDGEVVLVCSRCGDTKQEARKALGHDYRVQSSVEATCTEDGETVLVCSRCNDTKRETQPATGHVLVTVPARDATCTEPGIRNAYEGCSVCGFGLTEENTIPATGHEYETREAEAPTCTEDGHTAYRVCKHCGDTKDYQKLPSTGHTFVNGVCTCGEVQHAVYASRQAYTALGKLTNGKALQDLYDAIDKEQLLYLSAEKNAEVQDDGNGGTRYAIGTYRGEGLTAEELQTVWVAYRTDHPLFFWIDARYLITSGTVPSLTLTTSADYANGNTRAAKLTQILAGLSDLLKGVPLTGDYEIALYLHDRIIARADYAYKAGTAIPEDTIDAHSIAGFFGEGGAVGKVVCEGYAKLYHACLNARGVENMYVTGTAGTDHAWNLVKIGDAGWYWCDLTWDDAPELASGRRYDYFLKNDTEWLDERTDGGLRYQRHETFTDSHQPGASTPGKDYQYPLPDRAAKPIAESEALAGKFLLRSTAEWEGAIYARVGAEEIQLTALSDAIDVAGEFSIPETIRFAGDMNLYTVVAIGAQDADGYFGSGAIAQNITSIYLSKTVRTVWYGALAIPTLDFIRVSTASPYFYADKTKTAGVLYNKEQTVLVQYPLGGSHSSLVLFAIPDGVTTVAAGAFGDSSAEGVPIRAKNLTRLTIGKDVRYFGVRERGYGYAYGTDEREVTDQEIGRLFRISGGTLTFRVDDESQTFRLYEAENGELSITSSDGSVLYLACNKKDASVTVYQIRADVTAIGDYAFDALTALTRLEYAGGIEAFRQIVKNSAPYFLSGLVERGITTVVCTDGSYDISAES